MRLDSPGYRLLTDPSFIMPQNNFITKKIQDRVWCQVIK